MINDSDCLFAIRRRVLGRHNTVIGRLNKGSGDGYDVDDANNDYDDDDHRVGGDVCWLQIRRSLVINVLFLSFNLNSSSLCHCEEERDTVSNSSLATQQVLSA